VSLLFKKYSKVLADPTFGVKLITDILHCATAWVRSAVVHGNRGVMLAFDLSVSLAKELAV